MSLAPKNQLCCDKGGSVHNNIYQELTYLADDEYLYLRDTLRVDGELIRIHNSKLLYDNGEHQVFCPINCAKLAASNGYLDLLEWLMETFIFIILSPNNNNCKTNENRFYIFKIIVNEAINQ